jgi:ubiquinone/menaquinone biosynthesis C-methylase UbiE
LAFPRSYEKELLDGNNIPFEAIRRNMEELDFINTYLGGHGITLSGLKQLLKKSRVSGPVRIAEIGCGGGDNLRVIKNWAEKTGIEVQLTGIDYNAECIAFARQQEKNQRHTFSIIRLP